MNRKHVLAALAVVTAVSMTTPAMAQAGPGKVGIINIQEAIVRTKDGQKAAGDLQTRFAPKKSEIDKKNGEIEALRAQVAKGQNAMSADQREKLMRDIDAKTKSLQRETEDAQAELDQDQQKIMQELGQRMMAVIDKYAKDNGYSLILDVSSQQSPVLYAANSIDITREVIDLYDKNSPGAVSGSAPATSPAAKPAAAPPAATPKKPAAAK